MPIDITDQDRRAQYFISGIGPYSFDFEVLETTDVAVYRDSELLAMTADYTVNVNDDGTGSITLVLATGTTLTITGARPYARLTDFATGGDFFADTVNDEYDSIQIQILQLREVINRSLKFSPYDTSGTGTHLPDIPTRAGKYLGFAAVTGALTVFAGSSLAMQDSSLVIYTPSGSGAEPRNLTDRLNDEVSAFDYMTILEKADVATGAGTADVSEACQDAVNTGRSVYFPGGVYRIVTKQLWDQSNVKYRFAGDAVFLFDGAETTRLLDITGDNVTAEDFIFDGNNKQVHFGLVCIETDAANPKLKGVIKNIYGTHIGGSFNRTNNQYGLIISPYGVVGFDIDIFFDNIKNRNSSVGGWTPIEGGGFCGGVMFMKSDWTEPTVIQTAPTSGYLKVICRNIITELDGSLSLADRVSFNDADGVRTYGNDDGLTKLHVKIDGYFFNCSKRAIKVSASAGVKMGEITVVATTDLQYEMVTAVKVDGYECSIEDLKVYCPASLPIYDVLQSHTSNNLSLGRIWCNYAVNGWDIAPISNADALFGYRLESFIVGSLEGDGIRTSVLPLSITDCVFNSVSLTAKSTVLDFTAVELATISGLLDITINDLRVIDGDVKLSGHGWTLSGYQEIQRAGFTGSNSTRQLLEAGQPPNAAFTRSSLLKDYELNVRTLSDGWFNGGRVEMFSISGQQVNIENLRVTVPETLTVINPHGSIFGHDMVADGVTYAGKGFLYFMETAKATYGPYKRSSLRNATRYGETLADQPFIYCGDGQRCTVTDMEDLRDHDAGSIEVADGTAASGDTYAWIIDGVHSATSSAGNPVYGAAIALASVSNQVKF